MNACIHTRYIALLLFTYTISTSSGTGDFTKVLQKHPWQTSEFQDIHFHLNLDFRILIVIKSTETHVFLTEFRIILV